MWAALLLAIQPVGPADPERAPEQCEQAGEGEILICGDPPESPYRIAPAFRGPPALNSHGDRSVIRERMRWVEGDPMDYMGFCTAVGPGGWTGCMFEEWKRQRQEKGMAY